MVSSSVPCGADVGQLLGSARASFEERFCPEPNTGCWLWTGQYPHGDYGRFEFNGEKWAAHRAAWRLYVGPIPFGLFVCHHCDTPACVNPNHLFIGTHRKNMQDMREKGRGPAHITHCNLGHELTEENSCYYIKDDRRYRKCRTCNKKRKRGRS